MQLSLNKYLAHAIIFKNIAIILIGSKNDKEKFKPLWAHNKKEEKKNIIEFFEFTKSHFKKYPSSKIYHYGSYEITALLKLTSLYNVKGIEYDHYLNLDKFVNLLNVNKQGLFISENSYSLKNVEKFTLFSILKIF